MDAIDVSKDEVFDRVFNFKPLDAAFIVLNFKVFFVKLLVDIFIPEINTAIEYDGRYWHSGKENKDKKKQSSIEAVGIRLIRVREIPLKAISEDNVFVRAERPLSKTDVDNVIRLLDQTDDRIHTYLASTNFQNEELFRVYCDNFPSPLPT